MSLKLQLHQYPSGSAMCEMYCNIRRKTGEIEWNGNRRYRILT